MAVFVNVRNNILSQVPVAGSQMLALTNTISWPSYKAIYILANKPDIFQIGCSFAIVELFLFNSDGFLRNAIISFASWQSEVELAIC